MLLLGLLVLVPPLQAANAAPAEVRHAVWRPRTLTRGLGAELDALLAQSAQPSWIGWSVPAAQQAAVCCFEHMRGNVVRGGCCALEEREEARFVSPSARGSTALESPPRIRVLLRAASGRVGKVRAFSNDCVLDFGDRTLHWLGDVAPGESIAALLRLLPRGVELDEALSAVAAHAGSEADAALEALARRDPGRDIRSEALFWMAQRAADKAGGTIARAAREDPDTEVRKQAVFALSELPDGAGVPHLIDVARSHRDREVRRAAFFWLGESEDPRALDFIAEVLRH
jgi:hypothetical protein